MILVTGATGKVGKELVEALRASGTPFRIGARAPEKVSAGGAMRFDFDRPETFAPALAGVGAVFLLTSRQTEREAAAVDACAAARVRRIVKLSVWGAEEDAFTIGRGHRRIEEAIERSGIAYTFLRPNGFMQNFSTSQAAGIRTRSEFTDSAGDAAYSIVDARDVAAVAARALTEEGHEGKAYRLSGPEALSDTRLAQILSRAAGRAIRYLEVSSADYRKSLVESGVPGPYADALVDMNDYYRRGAGAAVTADVQRVTASRPRSFEDFAREYASNWN